MGKRSQMTVATKLDVFYHYRENCRLNHIFKNVHKLYGENNFSESPKESTTHTTVAFGNKK
jgi:hypothetical protein